MREPVRQVIALGGGGFSMEPDNPLLDAYILFVTGKESPKVCFVGTASGDSEDYRGRFYKAFGSMKCAPSHLVLDGASDCHRFVLAQDVIYVGGGNTVAMLAAWRKHGLDAILREAWAAGVVLAGLSAGSHCWFEQGLTDAIPGTLTPIKCLGFLKGSNCVHYDGEAERRSAYHAAILAGEVVGGLAAEDGVGLHFVSERLYKVVSSRPVARAYTVRAEGGLVVEIEIVPEFLGQAHR